MSNVWLSPGTWTHEQWLIFSIMAFVILAVLLISVRLIRLVRSSGSKRQLSDLRLGRRSRR